MFQTLDPHCLIMNIELLSNETSIHDDNIFIHNAFRFVSALLISVDDAKEKNRLDSQRVSLFNVLISSNSFHFILILWQSIVCKWKIFLKIYAHQYYRHKPIHFPFLFLRASVASSNSTFLFFLFFNGETNFLLYFAALFYFLVDIVESMIMTRMINDYLHFCDL